MSFVGRFGRGSLPLLLVPSLSLVALWIFTAAVTLGDGLNLITASALADSVGKPTDSLVTALQQERRATTVFVGEHGGARSELDDRRAATDKVITTFRDSATSGSARRSASDELEGRIDDTLRRIDDLRKQRNQIDTGRVNAVNASEAYNRVIDSAFRIYGSLGTLNDPSIARESRALVSFTRSREMLSREDALVASVLPDGQIDSADYPRLVQMVGTQRTLYTEASRELPDKAHAKYDQVTHSAPFIRYQELENQLVARGGTQSDLGIAPATWRGAVEDLVAELRQVEGAGTDEALAHATPVAVGIIVRIVLGGVLGLLAVIASIYLAIRVSRSLMRQLHDLRLSALRLAEEQLPKVVERLRRGEDVDLDTEAPPLEFGGDEIGQVSQAFNSVQRTAVKTAVEQAELRAGVSNVFLNIARRSQALLHRQLSQLDAMERKTGDPEDLKNLFAVDHLATRMRRYAENLIILGGAVPGRQWRKPVPMLDVLRSAASEVEDYARVKVMPVGSVLLGGAVVSDVIHLLAELIDNATSFSPPHTQVQIRGELVPKGFVVEIEDRGLGMSETDLAAANEWLANPPEFNVLALSDNARLGMFVVARITGRHGIQVSLRPSPYGGTTAIVLIPTSLLADKDDVPEPPSDEEAAQLADEPAVLREPVLSRVGAEVAIGTDATAPTPAGTPNGRAADESRTAPSPDPRPAPWPRPDYGSRASGSHRARPVTEHGSGDTGEHLGLPRRVRQASLASQLTDEPPPTPPPPSRSAGRSPEEIRQMMTSYQRESVRGRTTGTDNGSSDSSGDDEQPDWRTSDAATDLEPGDRGDTR